MRLSEATAAALPATVARPGYDRAAQAAGIVHFGIGAFHRAHQAWYTDAAMSAGDRDWAIIGVSLRSAGVAEQMNPQDGLYTVTERSGGGHATRLIGAVRGVLVAKADPLGVIEAVGAPATRIISFTITEKGYCRAADGLLDMAAADEDSIYRYLRDGLATRRERGLGGLTLLSCDNLAGNGRQLERLLTQYLGRHDPELGDWVAATCTFPSSMVDRIVPATTDADRDAAILQLGMADAGMVLTEPFTQWVVEDRFAAGRPNWEAGGATFVDDVDPYETAKLRMLNGAHSALAYLGLAKGHQFVHQAVADPELRPVIETLMRNEAAPTVAAAPGQNLDAYALELLARFDNPALAHRLIQIAMDGSQKIPQRWLETLAENQRKEIGCPAILAGIAAWIRHLRGANGAVDDPRSAELGVAASSSDAFDRLFGRDGLIASEWTPSDADRRIVTVHLGSVPKG